jgi:hypothetical protein
MRMPVFPASVDTELLSLVGAITSLKSFWFSRLFPWNLLSVREFAVTIPETETKESL